MKEEKAIDSEIKSKLIDSSVWITYIVSRKYIEIIDSEETLFLSVLSLFEIKKRFIKDKIPKIKIEENLRFIKERSILINITTEIAEKASELSAEKNIPAIDSLIYTTAILNKAVLLTLDNDFRNLENAIILD